MTLVLVMLYHTILKQMNKNKVRYYYVGLTDMLQGGGSVEKATLSKGNPSWLPVKLSDREQNVTEGADVKQHYYKSGLIHFT